ncbi:Alpha/Beta hydrolase protein [Aspergillus aurantiobrunneus]
MPNNKTVRVPHLGGIDAAYQMPQPYDSTKPTVVLVNSFTTSSELYCTQYDDKKLTDSMNLLSIELLGHGQTRTSREQWTYWDTAEMNLQVLDALGIDKAFVLGTSQGGWITVEMALLRPDKILGIIPLGTSLDSESERTRQLGCWGGPRLLGPFVKQWTADEPTPDFEPGDDFCGALISSGFNDCSTEVSDFWRATIKENYRGDEGRRRIRMATINLAERNGLHLRLPDVRCPVLWLHGTADAVYTVANAKEEIGLFTRSPDAQLVTVDGGAHFLSCTHPEAVDKALLEFVNKHK